MIIFLVQYSATAQTPMPSQKEVQAQLQEAKKEAASHISELEKQIADAKRNKEDPGKIREMEDQLAMMRKMMGLFNRTDTTMVQRPKNLPESKTVLPRYISPVVQIPVKGPVIAPTKEQAKDSMLWYRGRRLNDSMLVTTQRTVVLFSRNRNMIVVQADPSKDTLCINIARNMARNGQWTNEYINHLAGIKNSFFQYPQTMTTMDEFRFIEETYNSIIGNTIDLPPPGSLGATFFNGNNTTGGPSGSDDLSSEDASDVLRILHQHLVDHMRNPPPLNVTLPPAFYRPCVEECNTVCPECDNVNKRHIWIREWQERFLKYEKELLGRMKALSYWITRSGITNIDSRIPGIANDLNNALFMAFDRWDQKVKKLEELNNADQSDNKIFCMEIVIENLLYLQVQKKNYYGTVDHSYTSRINDFVGKNQQAIIDYYEEKMRQYEFHDVLDSWVAAGFTRHYKIIMGSGEPMKALEEKIRKFNRFALTLTIDFNVELRDGEMPAIETEGKLSNKDKVYVSLGRLSKCRWQLYLTYTDYTKMDEHSFRIPLVVENGTKYTYLKNPLRVVRKEYSGPKDMFMVFPYMSMNLCENNSEPDSMIVDVLRYVQEDLTQYKPGENEYSVDLLPYVNKLFISAEKTRQNSQDVVTEAFEMMAAAYTHGRVDRPTGYQKLDMMQVDFKMKGIQQQHQQMAARLTSFPNMLINLNAAQGNRNPTLLYENFGRSNTELEGNYNLKTGHGVVSIVHDPE